MPPGAASLWRGGVIMLEGAAVGPGRRSNHAVEPRAWRNWQTHWI